MTVFVLLSVFYFPGLINNNILKTIKFTINLHLLISLLSGDEMLINAGTQKKS